MGRAPTSNVHWLTFEDKRVPILAVGGPRSAKRMATMNSGDSEARGASHWIRRNSSIPRCFPLAMRDSANGFAARKIVRPA